MCNYIEQFRSAMQEAGLATDVQIVGDGALHRIHVDGDKRGARNGWYVLHSDGVPAGVFGSWKTGQSTTWRAEIGRSLTLGERAEHAAQMQAARASRIAADAERHISARRRAVSLWTSASERPKAKHPYLIAKGVRAHGLRQLREQLLVPVRDTSGELHGLQFIGADGGKKFLTGTAKAGCFYLLGSRPDASGAILAIAEGFATAATVHEATGWAAAVSFDAGNLRPAALALRSRYPAACIVVAADNDRATSGNPGLTKGRDAARAAGGIVIAPAFAAGEAGTDWNDYQQRYGHSATAKALLGAVGGVRHGT